MKIGFHGLALEEGKIKYRDSRLLALAEKDRAKKIVPLFVEFIKDQFENVDVIAISKSKILDLLILDMEKIETRLDRSENSSEIDLLKKYLKSLENETPISDIELNKDEMEFLKSLNIYSITPTLVIDDENSIDQNSIIEKSLEKSNLMFFYTTGPKESHAWLVKKNSTIIECAGKIHSDLARGFIRGDVVDFEDYMKYHNFNECKSKGVAKVVERDYIVKPNQIIEIRFSV